MTADKRGRAARWLTGTGIEIGALHNPLPVPPSADVRYVDRMRSDELRRHYPELAAEALVPVSIIGDAHNLEAVADGTLDFVIANHLLEHLDDPIRGLKEMTRVLRPGGILYVALPDPRVSFDRFRTLTTVEHILDEHRNGTEATRRDHFHDWVHNVETRVDGAQRLDAAAEEERVRALMELDYSIHFHVWRPETFLEFLVAASREGGLSLELLEFHPCRGGEDNEFIFVFANGLSDEPVMAPVATIEGNDAELRQQLQRTEAALRALERSRSWQLTAPLRAASRRMGAMRHNSRS
jgi:SAM-dependent methyltransferase